MKEKYKDGLSRPFEKELNKDQTRLYGQVVELCNQDFVIKMTYPEIFDVMDRLKLRFQLDLLRREGKITFNVGDIQLDTDKNKRRNTKIA